MFKPNDVETPSAVQLPQQDRSIDANLQVMAERIAAKRVNHFPNIVITPGEHGAALISGAGLQGDVYHLPAIPAREPAAGIAIQFSHPARQLGDLDFRWEKAHLP